MTNEEEDQEEQELPEGITVINRGENQNDRKRFTLVIKPDIFNKRKY